MDVYHSLLDYLERYLNLTKKYIKMGLEVSNLIYKNMTKSILLWLSFPWVFNDLPVLREQMLLTNERTISSWIDQ